MTESSITTRSARDWSDWGLENAVVSDGGIAIARTTRVATRSIATGCHDVAITRNGDVAYVTGTGRVVVTDQDGETDRTVGPANGDGEARAIDAAAGELAIAETTGTVHRIRPRTERTIDRTETGLDPISRIGTTRTRTLVRTDEGVRTLDAGTSGSPAGGQPRDVAGDGDRAMVLERHDDGAYVRALSGGVGGGEERLAGPLRFEGEPIDPTAIATVDDRLFLGTSLPEGGHAVLEFDAAAASLRPFTRVDGPVRAIAAGTNAEDRTVVAAITEPDGECILAVEHGQARRHPRTDDHRALALHRYDSGAETLEWHRIAIQVARSSIDTDVSLRYYASDSPTLFSLAAEAQEAETAAGGAETGQSFVWVESTADTVAADVSPDLREALVAAGFESLWELVTTDPETLVAETSLSRSRLRTARTAAMDAIETEIEANWTTARLDDADALLEGATGRYLFVALELTGTAAATPHVESLTAFCPRTSYLRYLPDLYQRDEASAAFLERFLSVFETSFSDIERELDEFTRYLDPAGTPTDALAWLESWLAADEYRDWPAPARRAYLARAPERYRRRGTRRGLRETIELYLHHAAGSSDSWDDDPDTDHRLFFLEPSDLDGIPDGPTASSYRSLVPTDHSFVVFGGPFDDPRHERAVEHIVETETPAHVDATVLALSDDLVLGPTSFLGRNTTLGAESFGLGEARLGRETYLGENAD
ncbi:phage tail protein [Halovivax limisalsi]|uniref:phage tail protein n=1 Tax=Halovivax limisalsi TaxID=1453760 RepID=UPI001FFC8A85|nr:phage tail protein [Halovivax limisalsi]